MWSEASFGEAQSGAGENAAFIMAVGCSDGNSVLKVVVTIDMTKAKFKVRKIIPKRGFSCIRSFVQAKRERQKRRHSSVGYPD